MVMPVRFNKDTSGSAMIDPESSTQFIDLDFAINNNLSLTLKPIPAALIIINGREGENQLTHTSTLELTVDQYLEIMTFQVTKLAGWNMILEKT